MRTWLAQLRHPKKQSPLASVDAAVSRLAVNHNKVPRETLRAVAAHLTVEREGELHWAFDALHRTSAPTLFRADAFQAFVGEIDCPVMFISGGDQGWHPSDEAKRLEAFPSPPKQVVLPDAGHMMHWTRPAEVAEAIATFVAEGSGR
jgi:pimeloyl-ACP methyl ester carboxylesterase